MKRLLIITLLITKVALNYVSAQPDSLSTTDSAMIYLVGANAKYDPSKAFMLFMQRAQAGDAKAMNAIGLQYAKGLGVSANVNLAVYWLTQAANGGYTKAWMNLGMLYKRNAADSIGYAKAYNCFSTALQQNEVSGFFAKGYMLYKGLGCTQSYYAALTLFRQGAVFKRADCIYFTGLCFKYGYGVSANADSAEYYINEAALLGYNQANAELVSTTGNTQAKAKGTKASVLVENYVAATEPYTKIKVTKQFIQLAGIYKGHLTQYDYSGKMIITEIPLMLQLSGTGNRLTGWWQHGNSDSIEIQMVQYGNELTFSSSVFLNSVIKARGKKQKLIFKTAQINIEKKNDSIYLSGSLQLFNTYSRESERPISLKLVRVSAPVEKQKIPRINVFPNPVSTGFNIVFILPNTTPVKINIYNSQGQLVYTQITKILQSGKQSLIIEKELGASGVYMLNIDGNNIYKTIAFVKG